MTIVLNYYYTNIKFSVKQGQRTTALFEAAAQAWSALGSEGKTTFKQMLSLESPRQLPLLTSTAATSVINSAAAAVAAAAVKTSAVNSAITSAVAATSAVTASATAVTSAVTSTTFTAVSSSSVPRILTTIIPKFVQ